MLSGLKKWLLLLIVACLLAGIFAALRSGNFVTAQEFDRRAMLTNITNNVILPNHAAFVEKTGLLQEAAYTFRDDPTPGNLAALQQVWRDTSIAWEYCRMFEFGRMTIYHSPINRKPTEPDHIEDLIAGEEVIDEAFIESIGSSSKGLPAVEYLLFDPVAGDEAIFDKLTSNERRMAYMVSATENLHNKATALYDVWLPEGQNYAETFINADGEGAELRESVGMLTNRMVYALENVMQMKLGRPLGLTIGAEVRPETVDAPYSDYSVAQMIADVESVKLAFTGGEGLGFDDYLDFLGAEDKGVPLSELINAGLDATIAALGDIEEPMSVALVDEYETVINAFATLRDVFLLMQVGMTWHLGVTLSFSDNDGD